MAIYFCYYYIFFIFYESGTPLTHAIIAGKERFTIFNRLVDYFMKSLAPHCTERAKWHKMTWLPWG